jgi:hypothetical protein
MTTKTKPWLPMLPYVVTSAVLIGYSAVARQWPLPLEQHWPRLLSILLILALAALIGRDTSRRRGWRFSLGWAAAILGGVVLAWVLVPTTTGLNLWTAWRETEQRQRELATLPVENLADYRNELKSPRRATVLAQFPECALRVEKAESAWGQRRLDQCRADLDALPPGDLAGFRACRELDEQVAALFPVAEQLRAAEYTWARRTAMCFVAELRALPADDRGVFDRGKARRADFVEVFAEFEHELHAAESGWVRRYGIRTAEEAEMLLAKEPVQIAALVVESQAFGIPVLYLLQNDFAGARTRLCAASYVLASHGEDPSGLDRLMDVRRRVVAAHPAWRPQQDWCRRRETGPVL